MIGTPDTDLIYINEAFEAYDPVIPAHYDLLLADGWRHFGMYFCRYNLGQYCGEIRRVIPLRIRLSDFAASRSQRRILKKNLDLQVTIGPVSLTNEVFALFDRHKERFIDNVPDSIYTFISPTSGFPTDLLQVTIRFNTKLLAVSFFDCGEVSVSAIYQCFDPAEKSRSLGIFCMLRSIEWALANHKIYYYPGYAYEGESYYDYKKRFSALFQFDWKGHWEPFII